MTRAVRGTAPRRDVSPVGFVALLAVVLLAVLVAACGTGTASQAPGGSASAGAGSSAAASDDTGGGPSPTPWPGGVVEAVVILGKADLEIKAAGGDLGAAAAYEDLEKMWGAADGLATLVDKLPAQVDRIRDYPVTAAAAKAYDAALPDMSAGAHKVADSIKAGDSAGLTAGIEQLSKGTAAYEAAREALLPLVEPALLMQRVLVK